MRAEKRFDLLPFILILLIFSALILATYAHHTFQTKVRESVLKEIGKAMCNGYNALDGLIYTQEIACKEVYILRCYFEEQGLKRISELHIGWLEVEGCHKTTS